MSHQDILDMLISDYAYHVVTVAYTVSLKSIISLIGHREAFVIKMVTIMKRIGVKKIQSKLKGMQTQSSIFQTSTTSWHFNLFQFAWR